LSGGPLQLSFPGVSLMSLNVESELRLDSILERIVSSRRLKDGRWSHGSTDEGMKWIAAESITHFLIPSVK
jgi:hypothetical protein